MEKDVESYDMHCHLVPDVDDGSDSVEESIGILHREYADGVRTVIITPHYRRGMFETSRRRVREQFALLREAADGDAGLRGLRLFLGCEFHYNSDAVRMLRAEPAYVMPDGWHVLLEFSSMHSAREIRDGTYDLLAGGFKPVIAHVERYPAVADPAKIDELRKMGAEIQVNADAVLGIDGFGTKRFCAKLIADGLVDYIGSDAHNMRDRAPHLGKCAARVEKKFGADVRKRLMEEDPSRLIPHTENDGSTKKR